MKHSAIAILASLSFALISCASAPAPGPNPTAETPGSAGPALSNWTFTPDFKALGIQATTVPGPVVGESTAIVFDSANELSLAFSISSPTYKKDLSGTVRTSQDGGRYLVSVDFPESGDYALLLFAKKKADGNEAYKSISKATFTATVAPIVVPEGWKAGPSFRKYGVAVSSAELREDQAVARISLAFNTPLSIAYSLRNTSTGADAMPEGTVRVSAPGASSDIAVCFPVDGEYELGLYAKAVGAADYSSIATVRYSIKVPDSLAKMPDNWKITPAFRMAGLSFITLPPREAGDSTTIRLSVPAGFSASALVRPLGATKWLGSASQEVTGTELRIVAAFPSSGAYELQISGKALDDAGQSIMAKAQLTAVVDSKLSRFFLWPDGASWPRLPAINVTESAEAYNPFDDSFPPGAHFKGLMAEDFAFPGLGAAFIAKKSSVVEFAAPDGADVKTISFILAKDAQLRLGDSPLSFKAGSTVSAAVNGYTRTFTLLGQASKDTKLSIGGGELLCPAQSRFYLWDGILERVDLKGKGTFTYAKKAYECAGSVFTVEMGEQEAMYALRVATTKDSQIKIGHTLFAAPAASILTFSPAAFESILFSKDSSISVDGVVEPIGAGWTVELAADGSVKAKYQAED